MSLDHDLIRRLRESQTPPMSRKQLGMALGYDDNESTRKRIERYERGLVRVPDKDLEKMAALFQISFFDFFEGISPSQMPTYFGPIPTISWVQAGEFSEAVDVYPEGVSGEDDPVYSRKKVGPRAFALRIEGESMMPRFMPGDRIIVDPDLGCENGDLCVVKCNDEVTFKRVRFEHGNVVLRPFNMKYPDITIRKETDVDFQIIGRVVDMIPSFDSK